MPCQDVHPALPRHLKSGQGPPKAPRGSHLRATEEMRRSKLHKIAEHAALRLFVVFELMPMKVIEAQRETSEAIRFDDGSTTRRMRGTEPDLYPALVMNDRSHHEIPSIGFKCHQGGDLVGCHHRTVSMVLEADRKQ